MDSDTAYPTPVVSFELDTMIRPVTNVLYDATRGEEIPLSRFEDEEGLGTDFIADQIVLVGLSAEDAASLAELWGGEVVEEDVEADAGTDPADNDDLFLVRVDATMGDVDTLEDNLLIETSTLEGHFRVSDEAGLGLLAILAQVRAEGVSAGLDFLSAKTDYEGSSLTEGMQAGSLGTITNSSINAFDWSYVNDESTSMGLGTAWKIMDASATDMIVVAVIDTGFWNSDDLPVDCPSECETISVYAAVDDEDIFGVDPLCGTDDSSCWHGTKVASTLTAMHNNSAGGAGTGTQVVRPVYVLFDYSSAFKDAKAVRAARRAEVNIISMSFGSNLTKLQQWADPLRFALRKAHKEGILLIAAAGNDGRNVNRTNEDGDEMSYDVPCEFDDVICVGGLSVASLERAEGSNYGLRSVDIFAPYTVVVGETPDNPGSEVAQSVSGTSFSTPFVAGIAAMMWAVNPGLEVEAVEDLLIGSARGGLDITDDTVTRVVDAASAVRSSAGDIEWTPAEEGETSTMVLSMEATEVVTLEFTTTWNPTSPSSQGAVLNVYSEAGEELYSTESLVRETSPTAVSWLTFYGTQSDHTRASIVEILASEGAPIVNVSATWVDRPGYNTASATYEEAEAGEALALPAAICGSLGEAEDGQYVKIEIPAGGSLSILGDAWCDETSASDSVTSTASFYTDGRPEIGGWDEYISLGITCNGAPEVEADAVTNELSVSMTYFLHFYGIGAIDDFCVDLSLE